jgi:hypothetical protein
LAGRPQEHTLANRPVAFVDAEDASLVETTITARGSGHRP